MISLYSVKETSFKKEQSHMSTNTETLTTVPHASRRCRLFLTSTLSLALAMMGCDPNANPAKDPDESGDNASNEKDPSQKNPDQSNETQDSGEASNSQASGQGSKETPKDKSSDKDPEQGEDGQDSSGEPSPDNPGETGGENSPDKPGESTGESEGDQSTGEDSSGESESGGSGSGGGDDPGGNDDTENIDCEELTSSGVNKGDVLPELLGTDENGEPFSLHALCNRAVLFEVSTGWCGPCNQVAPHLQSLYEKYKDQGFEVVTVLAEGFRNGTKTTQADLKRWKSKHGLTHKVVAPSNVAARSILKKYWSDSRGFPSSKLMGPGMVIHGAQAHSDKDDQIEGALPK